MQRPRKTILFLLLALLGLGGCSARLKSIESRAIDWNNATATALAEPDSLGTIKLPAPPKDALLVNPNTVLFTSYRGDLFVLDLQKGKRQRGIWKPFRKPVEIMAYEPAQSMLYLSSPIKSDFIQYNLQKARIVYKHKLHDLRGSAVLHGDTIYVCQKRFYLLGFERQSGQVLLRAHLTSPIISGLHRIDDRLYCITEDGILHYFDCKLQPVQRIDLQLEPRARLQVQDSLLTAVNSDGRLLIFNVFEQKMLFRQQLHQAIYSLPLFTDERHIFIGTADGSVSKLDRHTGDPLWTYTGQELLKLPLVDLPTAILVPYTIGKIVLLDKESGSVLWQDQLPHKIRFAIPLLNGFLVASGRNKIHWYGVNP